MRAARAAWLAIAASGESANGAPDPVHPELSPSPWPSYVPTRSSLRLRPPPADGPAVTGLMRRLAEHGLAVVPALHVPPRRNGSNLLATDAGTAQGLATQSESPHVRRSLGVPAARSRLIIVLAQMDGLDRCGAGGTGSCAAVHRGESDLVCGSQP